MLMEGGDWDGLLAACERHGDAATGGDPQARGGGGGWGAVAKGAGERRRPATPSHTPTPLSPPSLPPSPSLQLWHDALEYFGRQEGDCAAHVRALLARIEAGALLPPLVVLQVSVAHTRQGCLPACVGNNCRALTIRAWCAVMRVGGVQGCATELPLPLPVLVQALSRNPNFRLALVKDYVTRQLQAENRCVGGGGGGGAAALQSSAARERSPTRPAHSARRPACPLPARLPSCVPAGASTRTRRSLSGCGRRLSARATRWAGARAGGPWVGGRAGCSRRTPPAPPSHTPLPLTPPTPPPHTHIHTQVRRLREEPVVFQASRDSQTGAPLELPSVHFLCGHSFNLR